MNRKLLLIPILVLGSWHQTAAQEQTYKEKYETIVSLKSKYPEEVQFAKQYLKLVEDAVGLLDSIQTDFMESARQDASNYFINDKKTNEVYNRLQEIYSVGLTKIRDPKRKDLLHIKLQNVDSTNDSQEWIDTVFKNNSQIESLAEIRQIQTNCFEAIDIVFDDMIVMLKN